MNLYHLTSNEVQEFQEIGFIGPCRFSKPLETASLYEDLKQARFKLNFWNRILKTIPGNQNFLQEARWGKAKWNKGLHLVNSKAYQLATHPMLLDKVVSVLGPDILLWGSLVTIQSPGQQHSWHADSEYLDSEGVTVWLCLKSVEKQTPLKLMTRSHHLPTHPCELRHKTGLDARDDKAVLEAAQRLDKRCERVLVDAKPGEFVIFSRGLWHSIRNQSSQIRSAILFRYSPPSEKIKRIMNNYDYPFVWDSSSPPCCLVRGKDTYGHNTIVTPEHQGRKSR